MKKISDHVYQISLGSVNAFVVEDDGLTLVDTGVNNSKDKIFAAIKKAGKSPEDLKQIILTHSHPDHSGSAADIKRALNIPVYLHSLDIPLLEKGIGGRLPHQPSPGVFNWLIFNIFIKNSPNETDACTVDYPISDGQVLPGTAGMEVIHTPGHCQGHIALLVKKDGLLIAGDICANMFGLDYSIMYEDRTVGVASILKAAAFDFDMASFGHGNPLVGSANKKLFKKFS